MYFAMSTRQTATLSNLYGLAFRNLWTRKTRTLLTALGIVLGVAVILAINIANSSTLASINKIFDEAWGLVDLVIVPSSLIIKGGPRAHHPLLACPRRLAPALLPLPRLHRPPRQQIRGRGNDGREVATSLPARYAPQAAHVRCGRRPRSVGRDPRYGCGD